MDTIQIRGARTHNLKNVDVDLPRDKLIVITGLSGSGKSSLAFDTIYAEGQRRYVESLSAYARQFLSMMEKPDVDTIEGLSPAISIEQKATSHNPRSTVGTVTEIYDYLRLLYARVGEPRCPEHDEPLAAQTVSQMVDQVLTMGEGTKLMLLAPVVQDRKGEHFNLIDQLKADGFIRARIDGRIYELDEAPMLAKNEKHNIEVVVDRFKVRDDIGQRLAESFETCLRIADGTARIAYMDDDDADKDEILFSAKFACPICSHSIPELEPRLFSFNSPIGACTTCDGLGVHDYFDEDRIIRDRSTSLAGGAIRGWDRRTGYYFQMLESLAKHYQFDVETPFEELDKKAQKAVMYGSGRTKIKFEFKNDKGDIRTSTYAFEGVVPNMERRYRETDSQAVREELSKFRSSSECPDCGGHRLNTNARHVFVGKTNLPTISALTIEEACDFFGELNLEGARADIANKILKEITDRLNFLLDVGLDYLTLHRSADTLSGGEAQRIRLASQIGAGLVGVMYVLDEPSIGLHQRDNERLLKTLIRLRDMGNTIIVVEHDEDAIRAADHLVDMGPGAGVHGGEVVAHGTPEKVFKNKKSITGQYLTGKLAIECRDEVREPKGWLKLFGASGNNLQDVDLEIPMGVVTCITGVSGSGKSTLINDTLYRYVAQQLNRASTEPKAMKGVEGLEQVDKVIDIDQSPIGRTPRSNPATYTGLFTPIRELFSGTPEARARGYKPGRFSFNVKGGRCEACQGDGMIKVEMHFLPDMYVTCDVCQGQRYNRETLEVKYKGKNIHEVLNLTIEDAVDFFSAVPAIHKKLQTLCDVGLTYIRLGQSATTLSGGEAQRVKLAKELSKRDTGNTLYILDEPTTGLHFHDIAQLLKVIQKLCDAGNTIVIIEHNLDVIKTADWIVDLGPEGGSKGGRIIATGEPKDVALVEGSHTARFLKALVTT